MYAVIFEVEPEPDHLQDYLDIAARLRPELEKIDGFISIERFKSRQEQHHAAQRTGRDRIFRDYRIRVAAVVRDYGMYERAQAPQQMPPKSTPA